MRPLASDDNSNADTEISTRASERGRGWSKGEGDADSMRRVKAEELASTVRRERVQRLIPPSPVGQK